MFKTVGVRVAAGSQCGGVLGVLLTAGFYGLHWAPMTTFTEEQQMRLMLITVMFGAFYGIFFGTAVAFAKKIIPATIGVVILGTAGMFLSGPLAEMIAGKGATNAVCLPILALFTIAGAFLGSWFIPEWWKKKETPSPRA